MKFVFLKFVLIFGCITYQLSSKSIKDYNLNDILSDNSGSLFLATEYGGLFISSDDGNSWKLTNTITSKFNLTSISYNDYEGIFLATFDKPLLQSTDKGISWNIRQNEVNNMVPITNIISTSKNYKVFSVNDVYGICNDNFNTRKYVKGLVNAFHFTDDGELYAVGKDILKNDNIDDFENTSNNWKKVNNGISGIANCITSNTSNLIFIGTTNGLYFSSNNGENWQLRSNNLKNISVTAISIQNNFLTIVVDSTKIFNSQDNGLTWQENNIQINSKINKLYKSKSNSMFLLTSNQGLYKSTDYGLTWINLNNNWDFSANSLKSEGWMPSINYFDVDSPTYYPPTSINFSNNDSLIIYSRVSKNSPDGYGFYVYDTKSGKLILDKSRNEIEVIYYNVQNVDTVYILYKKLSSKKINFGVLSLLKNEIIDLFSLDESYFQNQIIKGFETFNYYISYFGFSNDYRNIRLSYVVNSQNWDFNHTKVIESDIKYKNEYLDIKTGILIKTLDSNCVFTSKDNYYLKNNSRLFDGNDNLVYDINLIQGNLSILNKQLINNAIISPNNKFIVLISSEKYLVVDFTNGQIINEINFNNFQNLKYRISYDDNYLFTSSNEGKLRIYNLYNSFQSFDSVSFFFGTSISTIGIGKVSNILSFRNVDMLFRLWKPNFSLTDVKEINDFTLKTENNLIFPNPAENFIELTSDLGFGKIELYNPLGIKIIDTEYQSKIDVSKLITGIYFLKLNEKLIKFVKK